MTWFLAALPLAQTLLLGGDRFASTPTTALLQFLAVVLLVLSAVRIVQLDPANDPAAFLATRPLTFPTVLLPKLAIISFGLILPIAALHVAQIACLGIPLNATDYLLLALETLLSLCAITFLALLPAFFRRNLGDYLVALVICGVAIAGVSVFVRWDTPTMPVLGWESYQLGMSRQALVLFLCPVVALGVIFVYACSRSWRRAGALFVVASIVIVLVRALWPIDFIRHFADRDQRTPASECPDLAQVSARFEKPRWAGDMIPSFGGIGYNGVLYYNVEAHIKYLGVPTPWYPVQRSFTSTLTLSNGKALPCRGTMPPSIDWLQLILQRKIRNMYDTDPHSCTPLQLDQYKVDEVNGATKNAAVRGNAVVELRRAIVIHELSLQEGATFAQEGRRFTVKKVSYTQERLQVEIWREEVSLLFRGGTLGRYDSVDFVLVNELRHEFVDTNGGSMGGGFAAANYSYKLEQRDYEPAGRKIPVRFTDDWIRGARLLLIGSESGGTLNVPFEFQSFDLVQ